MQSIFYVLNFIGDLLRLTWKASCAAILYFFGAACFYHGSWWVVAEVAVLAGALYLVTTGFDRGAAKLYATYKSRRAADYHRGVMYLA